MSENINNDDLNEVFEEEMDDADVITVPIDETLSNSGEAADAAAVGAALALKADKDELPATIKVNGQQADNQGLILINGSHIPVDGSTQKTLAEAVSEVSDMTAETIPMSGETGAATIAAEIEDIKEDVSDLQEAIDGMEEKTADNILMETGSTTTVKNAIETLDRKAVKSVNRKLPDAAGDVDLSVVPLAENLQSDKLQSIEGEFIIRTTGGNGAVADGKAYPQHIYGNCQHNGYVEEVLNMTVIPITRTEPDEPITATLDRDTFIAAVTESSTINLYYTTEWSEDPADYGVTVTGDPVAGDQITIVYVKEQRGTILVADPDRLVGTGWNLFNANEGYARVVKYSDVYGYKIGGTYTSIAFSATLTGDRTSLLPNANGLFSVPSDGYVFVTGGNTTDTYILATWSDWTNGPSTGYWEAYRESGIDLSAVVETYFPYGMLKIGSVRDEIDLVAKRSISRIERMVYSEENRAAAAASGRAYDFDESNIYLVRAEYVQNAITISTEYSVSEHGLEWFTETVLPLDTEILYGKNLRDKLERDVLTISAQTLTEEEKAQARTNIGAMSQAEGDTKLVAPTVAGTTGQLLHLKADGGTEWTDSGTPTDEQVGTAVSAWLEAHPEATTTVEDGAISYAKLNSELKGIADDVPDLKSALMSLPVMKNKVEKVGTFKRGYFHSGGFVNNYDYICEELEVKEGEILYVTCYAVTGFYPYCFYDSNGTYIIVTHTVSEYENQKIIVPANAVKLGLNRLSGTSWIGAYMPDINADTSFVKKNGTELDHTLKYGYYSLDGFHSANGLFAKEYNVTPNDTLYLSCAGNSTYSCFYFYDANGDVIGDRHATGDVYNNVPVVVPSNAVKLGLNMLSPGISELYAKKISSDFDIYQYIDENYAPRELEELTTTKKNGYFKNTGFVSDTHIKSEEITVTPYDELFVTCTGSGTFEAFYFYDTNGASIQYSYDGKNLKYEKITVPPDAVKLGLNWLGSGEYNVGVFKKTVTDGFPINDIMKSIHEIENNENEHYWKNKSILWLGTSIPYGRTEFPNSYWYSYPTLIGEMLGCTMYNEALGSSCVRAGDHSRVSEEDPFGWTGLNYQVPAYGLSMSIAEKQDFIDNYATWKEVLTRTPGETLSDEEKAIIIGSSYENKIDPYLSTGAHPVDLFVIDHGYNDASGNKTDVTDMTTIPQNPTDRTYFQGALRFIIERILNDNPKARIVFIGHYENDRYPAVYQGQLKAQDIWKFPIFKTWEHIGWSQNVINGKTITNTWCVDDIHPATGGYQSIQHYANTLYPFIRDLRK